MKAVPGRMEKVDEGQPFGVVVDYAHTEDALVRLLEAVREIAAQRVITVFGCGGDRDRTKGRRWGRPRSRGATSSSLRPITRGRKIPWASSGRSRGAWQDQGESSKGRQGSGRSHGKTPYYVIPDRHEAVAAAIRMAKPGDVVVLAGKGHEDYQIIGRAQDPLRRPGGRA